MNGNDVYLTLNQVLFGLGRLILTVLFLHAFVQYMRGRERERERVCVCVCSIVYLCKCVFI